MAEKRRQRSRMLVEHAAMRAREPTQVFDPVVPERLAHEAPEHAVQQRAQARQHLLYGQLCARAGRFGCLESPAAREDRQPAKQGTSAGIEQS